MPMRFSNMFPLSDESLVKNYDAVFAQQSKTNESSRVFVLVMIVRAPATPLCEKIRDCVLRYDGLVYRFWGVVDLGRTTQFLEPHTARGGFESIQLASTNSHRSRLFSLPGVVKGGGIHLFLCVLHLHAFWC